MISRNAMEGNSSQNCDTNAQLAMINDSGGVHVTVNAGVLDPVIKIPNSDLNRVEEQSLCDDSYSVTNYSSKPASASGNLIATAMEPMHTGDQQEVVVVSRNESSSFGGKGEEGIIFRNPTSSATSAGNSKVHFISNLTLIAKQQQPVSARTAGQNIIFLNSGHGNQPTISTSLSPAVHHIDTALLAKGIGLTNANSATLKSVNLLHSAGSKAPPSPGGTQAQRVKGALALKRSVVPQNLVNRVSAAQSQLSSGAPMPAKRGPNIVITGAVPTASAQASAVKTSGNNSKIVCTTGSFNPSSQSSVKVVGTVINNDQSKVTGSKLVRSNVLDKTKHVPLKTYPKLLHVQTNPVATSTSGHWRVQTSESLTRAHMDGIIAEAECEGSLNKPTPKVGTAGQQSHNMSSLTNTYGNGLNSTHQKIKGTRNNTVKIVPATTQMTSAQTMDSPTSTNAINFLATQGSPIQQYNNPSRLGAANLNADASSVYSTNVNAALHADLYYVNDGQMSDEMSARLLQNFSQKATSRLLAKSSAMGHCVSSPSEGPTQQKYSAENLYRLGQSTMSGSGSQNAENVCTR